MNLKPGELYRWTKDGKHDGLPSKIPLQGDQVLLIETDVQLSSHKGYVKYLREGKIETIAECWFRDRAEAINAS